MLHMKIMEAILHADHDSMLEVHTPSKATQFSKLCYTHTNKRLYVDLAVRHDYSSPAARALRRPRRAPRLLVSGRRRSTSTSPCTATTRLHSPSCSDLLRLRRASGCLGTSRGPSRGSSRCSSSTTLCSSSTTSPPPRVRVPRHVARPVTRLVALLIVDYSGLIIDYFASASAARPGASARRAARLADRCAARRRLLRLRRAAGWLGTSCGTSRGPSRGPPRGSSSTTPCAATSSCGHTGFTSATPCVVTTCLAATLSLLRVHCAPP
jgi:hypothetical protein